MARVADPKIKELLFKKCVTEILKRGTLGFSINELGTKIGSSGRMLVYHFYSKENLDEMIIGYIEEELRKVFLKVSESKAKKNFMLHFWDRLTTDKYTVSLLVIMHEAIYSSSKEISVKKYLKKEADMWMQLFIQQMGNEEDALVIWMVINGALANFVTTRDNKKGRRALSLTLKALDRP